MNIRYGFVACLIAAAFTSAIAQEPETLQETAATPAVAQAMQEPDGTAFKFAPDGSLRIFSRASASYDFADEDDVSAARKEAVLKAKAGIAKFMEEVVSSDDSVERINKKLKKVSNENGEQNEKVSMENARRAREIIRSRSEALLSGLVILQEQRIPNKTSGGVIHVVMGVSSKTLEAAERLKGGNLGKKASPAAAKSPAVENKGYIRASSTDF